MTKAAQADGQNPGQTQAAKAGAGEEGDAGGDDAGEGEGGSSSGDDKFATLEARFELLNDSLSDLRQAILDGRRTQANVAPQVPDEDDDDEPLKASKVRKIVQQSVNAVAAQSQDQIQRQTWDDKAKSEFPLSDPKFLREFKQTWKEQTASGLDPRHPKAVYNVAKITAQTLGVKKPAARQADPETTHTPEATTSGATRPPVRQGSSRSSISDDDPRVKFYKMKGDRTKEQIEAMKRKLGERDATRRSAR